MRTLGLGLLGQLARLKWQSLSMSNMVEFCIKGIHVHGHVPNESQGFRSWIAPISTFNYEQTPMATGMKLITMDLRYLPGI